MNCKWPSGLVRRQEDLADKCISYASIVWCGLMLWYVCHLKWFFSMTYWNRLEAYELFCKIFIKTPSIYPFNKGIHFSGVECAFNGATDKGRNGAGEMGRWMGRSAYETSHVHTRLFEGFVYSVSLF